MFIALTITTGLLALSGLTLGVKAFFRRNTRDLPQAQFAEMKARHIKFYLWLWSISQASLLLLLTGYASPILIMIILPLMLALGYAMSRVDLNDFFEQLGNIGNKSGR